MIKHIFFHNGTLHLVLKAKWYDLIKSGIKKEEYRELTAYWARRLLFFPYTIGRSMPRNFISVCFHRGFTNEKSYYEFNGIEIGEGRPEWGAEPGRKYFIIKIGKEVKL